MAVTDAHPFWVVTDDPDLERAAQEYGDGFYHENVEPGLNGFGVEAKDLREGDVLLGANGELLTFVSKERVELEESLTVYNFTVSGNHNYFVFAETDEYGQTCVLVHNGDSWGEWLREKWNWLWGVGDVAVPPAVEGAVELLGKNKIAGGIAGASITVIQATQTVPDITRIYGWEKTKQMMWEEDPLGVDPQLQQKIQERMDSIKRTIPSPKNAPPRKP